MKARFNCHDNPTADELRQELESAFDRMGESTRTEVRERVSILTTETPIRHGGLKRWRVFNVEGFSAVCQTRPADSEFIYLAADPAAVVVGIELF